MFLIVSFIVIIACGTLDASCTCNTADVRAGLTLLHAATGGINWTKQTNWTVPTASVCEWHGVVCRDDKLIMTLHENNLVGSLPHELGVLFSNRTYHCF